MIDNAKVTLSIEADKKVFTFKHRIIFTAQKPTTKNLIKAVKNETKLMLQDILRDMEHFYKGEVR